MNVNLSSVYTRRLHGGKGPAPYWFDAEICMDDADIQRWIKGRPELGSLGSSVTVDAFTRALLDFLPPARRLELLQNSLQEAMEGGGE